MDKLLLDLIYNENETDYNKFFLFLEYLDQNNISEDELDTILNKLDRFMLNLSDFADYLLLNSESKNEKLYFKQINLFLKYLRASKSEKKVKKCLYLKVLNIYIEDADLNIVYDYIIRICNSTDTDLKLDVDIKYISKLLSSGKNIYIIANRFNLSDYNKFQLLLHTNYKFVKNMKK